MESSNPLHPNVEEQNQLEVNSGASNEGQTLMQQETENNDAVSTEPTEENEPVAEAKSTVAEIINEIDAEINTNDEAEIEGEEVEDVEIVEESLEEIEKEYENLDFEQLVETLELVVVNTNVNAIKQRVGVIKANVLDKIKAIKKEELEKFVADGGKKEEFEHAQLPLEDKYYASLQIYRQNKAKFIENLEKEKQNNLEIKNKIIEELKNLVESETNLKVLNDKFKELQESWKQTGPVPQGDSTNLWQNYHFYVEKFFDILRINKELRILDLRKNLDQKIKLCEAAETLLLNDSINLSFKGLQQLHNDWKEIGPVPEDKKDEIWERFKNASDQINQRRREYYDSLLAEQQNNYNAKVVLCEQAEELVENESTNMKDNNDISDKLAELLKMWKTLGPAPAKLNDEIWVRFKSTLDKFYTQKKEFFKQIRDEQNQNYNLKVNLAVQAEGIATRTDWKNATQELIQLQKDWKEIGAVSRKNSDAIWKRFREACDKFFAAKSEYFKNIDSIEGDNLVKKQDLIQRILTHEFTEDREANLEAIKVYQREWTELGHVPRKDKDQINADYRAAVNKRFGELNVNFQEQKNARFKSRLTNILGNPDADKILDKEKRFLRTKLDQLKQDIALWENNLGFFSNSKNADLLIGEFKKKIEAAKREVKDLEYKIKMTNAPKVEVKEDAATEESAPEQAE